MKAERVGLTCSWERMKILEVVIGSNHLLIQPHTVGKKEGAPMIWGRQYRMGGLRSMLKSDDAG